MERRAAEIVNATRGDDLFIENYIILWILQSGNPPALLDAIAHALVPEADATVSIIHDSIALSTAIPPYDMLAEVRQHRRAAKHRG